MTAHATLRRYVTSEPRRSANNHVRAIRIPDELYQRIQLLVRSLDSSFSAVTEAALVEFLESAESRHEHARSGSARG